MTQPIQTTITPAAPPTPWHEWIGLPHRLGADPRDGEACCCLELWFAVCDAAGTHIYEKDFLRMLARENQADGHGLHRAMERIAQAAGDFTVSIGTDAPRTGDMALAYAVRRGDPPVGVVVAVDADVELLMTHSIGLRAAQLTRRREWRRYRGGGGEQ